MRLVTIRLATKKRERRSRRGFNGKSDRQCKRSDRIFVKNVRTLIEDLMEDVLINKSSKKREN